MKNKVSYFIRLLGPGILFASTAIGVSHLVQSTRAGAQFGFALVIFVLMANIFKYPFFEFGSRYANATGESLIKGYNRQGKWVLFLYFLITLISMFTVVAAVSFVCSGLVIEIFDLHVSAEIVSLYLFLICIAILFSRKYKFLESFVKLIALVLLFSTVFAVCFVLFKGPSIQDPFFIAPNIWDPTNILFKKT